MGTAAGWKNMGKIHSAETTEPALTFRYCWKKEKRDASFKMVFLAAERAVSYTESTDGIHWENPWQYWSRCLGLPGRRMKSTVLQVIHP